MASDAELIGYLKANRLYDALSQAAGVAKDATVGDVHKPSAGGVTPPPTVATKPKNDDEPVVGDDDDAIDDGDSELAKRIAEVDVLFTKGDASLYVSRPLTPGSAQRLHDWAVSQGIPNVVPPELMHVTQVHSKAPVTGLTPQATMLDVPAQPRFLDALGTDGNALVMRFRSPEMQQRFQEAKAAGATHDFPGFVTHVTLSYDAGKDADWSMTDAPDMPLQLGPEQFRADNPNWVAENGLAKQIDFAFTKMKPDEQIIGGWAYVSTVNGQPVIDKQGDIIPIEELSSAFRDFVKYHRNHGEMHEEIGTGELVSCQTFTKELEQYGLFARTTDGKDQPMEGTWVEFHISNPETWKRIKSGELPEFSIGGRATPGSA